MMVFFMVSLIWYWDLLVYKQCVSALFRIRPGSHSSGSGMFSRLVSHADCKFCKRIRCLSVVCGLSPFFCIRSDSGCLAPQRECVTHSGCFQRNGCQSIVRELDSHRCVASVYVSRFLTPPEYNLALWGAN